MKTKEEIEDIIDETLEKLGYDCTGDKTADFVDGFVRGYTQCQVNNMEKKYTEEDIINIVNKSRETGLTAEYLILQLNKQN
jgi:hypothetical protein